MKPEPFDSETIQAARLSQFVDELVAEGTNQLQIAARAGLQAQYLSDMKRGRRPLTELSARRLSAAFGVSYEWLLGQDEAVPSESLATPQPMAIYLPLVDHPIEGEPTSAAAWAGAWAEVAGTAAARASASRWPYVSRFKANPKEGPIRKGDLLLISQSQAPAAASIFVAKRGAKLSLVRRGEQGVLERLADKKALPQDSSIVGYVIGLVWRDFAPTE